MGEIHAGAMTAPLRILYLVHDVSDAAVARRTAMLRDGGAAVTVAGFRRADGPVALVAGCPVVDLGRTHNGDFARRILAVLREVVFLRRRRALFEGADIVVARNLEMLAIAVRGRSLCRPRPALVYESLDIHRLLLGDNIPGRVLRGLEGWLSRRASLLITSSPAFVAEYFDKISSVRLPVLLAENKVYDPGFVPADTLPRDPGPPWRIGWFGIIRCRKSLHILAKLAAENACAIEVVIRGRPALDEIPDFHAVVAATPGLVYEGPYKNPDDLARIYGDVHFAWAIDMYEEGLNSSWLLPNRVYEGGLYNAVPLAREIVETGRFIKRLGTGVCLPDPLPDTLRIFFSALTSNMYQKLRKNAMEISARQWVAGRDDAQALVAALAALGKGTEFERSGLAE